MFPLCAQELGGGYLVDDTMPPDFSLLDHTDNYNKNYEPRRKRPESEPNNVLLFTIINPVYPITVDVLHTICKPNGQVLRIVIFKKNGVQAMVEFDSIDTAKRVKEALNGADIYAGCCTLKIEFAKPTKLNVYKNDMDSWDYTNPSGMDAELARHLEEDPDSTPFLPQTLPFHLPCWNYRPRDKPPETAHTRQAPLLQEPRFGVAPQLYRGQTQSNYMDFEDNAYTNGRPSAYGDYVSERYPPAPVDKFVSPPISPRMFLDVLASSRRFMVKGVPGREGLVAPPPPPPPPRGGTFQDLAPTNGVPGGAGCVLMAYGLDPNKANPDKLFNLFCLYGNVIRVKFLKTKEGCAMVQMGDNISVERCINHLKNMPLFGGTLQLGYSKQTFLSQVAQPYNLPDNSVSFKDFAASKNNRFMNPSMASKNRIQGPAKILHFFNTPPDITEEQLLAVIEEKEVNKPSQIKLFPKKDRSSSGLMEFDNLEDAVNCLVNCNHVPIKNPESKFPYMMKLCFSSSRTIRSPPNGSGMKDEAQQ
ncbi:heterogeneous nuclear ribonucleoprotein L isoform X3 [Cimex lectularius]|uniref:RRM domain-containing protein n=1 Tax=Cimex lectularius TaxID=79782 RepID=A0A8I6RZU7_CIMLE|nr:heterogeneous nuclear ribonucleoprotein L isoform X3 [Cimex lectularius]